MLANFSLYVCTISGCKDMESIQAPYWAIIVIQLSVEATGL